MNTLVKIRLWLQGKKTYFLVAAVIAYAAGGYFTGHLSAKDAIDLLFGSGFFATIRAAIDRNATQQVQLQNFEE